MSNLVRSEWIKIRTVRVNYVLSLIAFAFPVIVVGLVALLGKNERNVADDLVGTVTATMVLTSLLLGVIGALNLTSEFSHNTIRASFAAAPQRTRVFLAKALVTVATTLVLAAVIELATFLVGSVILSGRDAEIVVSGSDKAALAGAVALAGLLALLGFGLGLLIRHSAATVAILILWPLLLENIARGVMGAAGIEDQTPWLPYQSAIIMANPELSSSDPSRLHGGLYLGGVVLAFIVIGIFVNERRDA
ncbi:MAG: ABC transporter permease [Ilumatobacteraceae bacterium]